MDSRLFTEILDLKWLPELSSMSDKRSASLQLWITPFHICLNTCAFVTRFHINYFELRLHCKEH